MARIGIKTWCEQEGIPVKLNKYGKISLNDEDNKPLMDCLEAFVIDSVCPALCDEGCEVEPDGRCEHDCPSILLACGLV